MKLMTGVRLIFCLLALALAFTSAACGARSVPGVAAAVKAGAVEFKAEVAAELQAGDVSAGEAALLNPVLDEVSAAADGVLSASVNWSHLSRADRAQLAGTAVTQIGDSVERLSNQGVGLKSAKARASFAKYLREARIAVAALRVIQASTAPPAPPNSAPGPPPVQ
jgi:hypothetical protein